MTGAFTEDPGLPRVDPEVLAEHERKIAELMAEREERTRAAGVEGWQAVEELVDRLHLERVERIIARRRREMGTEPGC